MDGHTASTQSTVDSAADTGLSRRAALRRLGSGGVAAAAVVDTALHPLEVDAASQSTPEAAAGYMEHGAYGDWLAYMMDIKRVDSEKLAKVAGVSVEELDGLIKGEVPADQAREMTSRVGEVLFRVDPDAMDRVLKALEIHADLRNWRASCDGGCCSWNIVSEIAYPEALDIQ